jgi:hypothetical protein
MTRRQTLSLALLMPVTLALVGVLGAGLAQPVPEIPVNTTTPYFDNESFEQGLSTWIGSIAESPMDAARFRQSIADHLTETNLPVETQIFSATINSQIKTGAQIWATSPGATDEAILIVAPYADAPGLTLAGRLRGVSLLIELAKIFAEHPHHFTFVFMASDSTLGSPAMGAMLPGTALADRKPIVAVVELARFYPVDSASDILDGRGRLSGYSPLWLRQAGRAASVTTATPIIDPQGGEEFIYRALPFQTGNAAAYLGAGIPAIRLNTFNGSTIATFLHTLDALAPLPTDSVNAPYWRVSETHYLPNWATPLLQLILFAPLFVFTASAYRKDRPREEELRPEFTAFIAWAVLGVDGYAIAYSLVAARLLPQYELFPAAPGDPFLLQPTWWAALAIYGTMLALGWYTFRRKGWGRFADRLNLPYRRATLLILLSGLAVVTWFVNGFTAVVVFGLPAYLWPWIEPRPTLRGKLLNTALALAGLLPLLAGLTLVFGDPAFGPWWWFFPMAAAYGFIPFLTVMGFILFAALFIRFLQYGWRDA